MYCRKVEVIVELQKLLAEEEIFWFEKFHENWLLKGDQNTNYFHWIVNERRRKKTVEGTDNLLTHAAAFYKHLFGPAPSNLYSLVDNGWKALKICLVLLLSGLTELETSWWYNECQT